MIFIRKNIMKITFFVVFIFIISIIVIKNNLKNNEVYASDGEEILITNTINLEKKEDTKNEKTYFVDIKGQVLNPGVYKVYENTRVIDVINMAGGLLDNSDTSKINLAKKVKDEMVIIIYNKEDLKKDEIKEVNIDYSFNDALIKEKDLISSNSNNVTNSSDSSTSSTNELININTASKEQLMTLSGVGESKANAIISYREENGFFKTIEDLLNVSGIGNSIYEKIKNYITT